MNTNSNSPFEDKDRKEHAIKKLELVNSWLTNCDSKSSFILTLFGVFLTVIFTSDLGKKLLIPFTFEFTKIDWRSFANFILLLMSIAFFVFIFFTLYHIYSTLKARIDSSVYNQKELNSKSLMFFMTISSLTFEDYENSSNAQTLDKVLNDINSQVYINSKIAEKKFTNYNKSIKWMFWAIVLFLIFIIFDYTI